MKVVLKEPMPVADFSTEPWRHSQLGPGSHEVEEIPNPACGFAVRWWVLKGKTIGAAIPIWQQHLNSRRREK